MYLLASSLTAAALTAFLNILQEYSPVAHSYLTTEILIYQHSFPETY